MFTKVYVSSICKEKTASAVHYLDHRGFTTGIGFDLKLYGNNPDPKKKPTIFESVSNLNHYS